MSYAYDAAGALASVTDWVGGTTTFTYDAAGRRIELARPNGVTTRTTYDESSRPVKIEEVQLVEQGEVVISTTDVAWNANDLVSQISSTPLLPSALPSLGATQRSFDAAGQLAGATYDPLGRMLIDGVSTYNWDLAGRLRSHTNGTTTDLDYDGFDQVTVVSGPANAQISRNYALGGVISTITKSGQPETFFVHDSDGKLLHSVDAATDGRRFYHFELGSTSFLTDDSAAVTDVYELDPFGKTLAQSGTTPNPFVFLGERSYFRLGTDLYLLGTRPYDAGKGLFLAPDLSRAVDAGEGNPYVLSANNPTPRRQVGLPVPRFADVGTQSNLQRINVCTANVLFPFVSNQTGFDTGLLIANTSSDPFAGARGSHQSGACTINYFGRSISNEVRSAIPSGLSAERPSHPDWVSELWRIVPVLPPSHRTTRHYRVSNLRISSHLSDSAPLLPVLLSTAEPNHRAAIAKFRRLHPLVAPRGQVVSFAGPSNAAALLSGLDPAAFATALGRAVLSGGGYGGEPGLVAPAYLSALGAQRVAQGYLALVLDGAVEQRNGSLSETFGH